MQTDELRAELAELAREVDPFPEDLAAIRRRVTRRRVAGASVAVVLIVGLIAGAIATTRSSGDHINVAGHPKEVTVTAMPRIDVTVTLPAQASDASVTRVKGVLDSTAVVRNYARFPRKTVAFLILGKAFAHSIVLGVELDRSVVDGLQQLTAAVGSAATVTAFDLPKGRAAYDDVDIFMQVNACSAQIDAVRGALERDSDVESFRFFSKKDALNEFKKLFQDEPTLIENTTAASLPTSFRLRLRDGVLPGAIASRYEHRSGVKQVNTPANPLADEARSPIPENDARSICTP
jgi:hypothetical protein